MAWAEENQRQELLGARIDEGDTRFGMFNGVWYWYALAYATYRTPSGTVIGTDYKYQAKNVKQTVITEYSAGKQSIEIDGTLYLSGENTAVFDTGLSMYLFAENRSGIATETAKARLYSMKIWQDGTLVRNFRPCANSQGIPMLYDSVEGKLYQSIGNANFSSNAKELGKVGSGTVVMLMGI